MKYSIGLPNKHVQQSTSLLPSLCADKMILNAKTNTFHWTESDESVRELHKQYQEQYVERGETNDQIAERIVTVDEQAIGTTKEFLASTRLHDAKNEYPKRNDILKELSDNYEKAIIQLRKDIATNK